jgi:hypothetical protein
MPRARLGCAPVVAGDGEGQVTFLKRLGSMDEYPLLAYQSASTPHETIRLDGGWLIPAEPAQEESAPSRKP